MIQRTIIFVFYFFSGIFIYSMEKQYSVEDGNVICSLRAKSERPITSVVFSGDTHLAAGDGTSVSIWDVEKAVKIYNIDSHNQVHHIVVPPDNNGLVGTAHHHENDYNVFLWDKKSGTKVKEMIIAKDPLDDLWPHVFSFDGKKEFIGWKDGSMSCSAEPTTGSSLKSLCKKVPLSGIKEWWRKKIPSSCVLAAYGPEYRASTTYFPANFLEIWKKQIVKSAIVALAVSSDDNPYLAVSADKIVTLWQINSSEYLKENSGSTLQQEPLINIKGFRFPSLVKAVAFSLKQKLLAVGLDNGRVEIVQSHSL